MERIWVRNFEVYGIYFRMTMLCLWLRRGRRACPVMAKKARLWLSCTRVLHHSTDRSMQRNAPRHRQQIIAELNINKA